MSGAEQRRLDVGTVNRTLIRTPQQILLHRIPPGVLPSAAVGRRRIRRVFRHMNSSDNEKTSSRAARDVPEPLPKLRQRPATSHRSLAAGSSVCSYDDGQTFSGTPIISQNVKIRHRYGIVATRRAVQQ
jgi:hypothetical protein